MQTFLSSNDIKVRHIADGTTEAFSCTIELIDESYLQVYFGNELQTTGWTYDESFQLITFDEIPPEGTIITFLRHFPIDYTKSIADKGVINPEVLDNQMVEMVARIQTVEEKLSRTPTYPIDTEKSSEEVYDDFKRIESVATSAATKVLDTLEEIEDVRNEAVLGMGAAADAAKLNVSKYTSQMIDVIKDEGQESIDIARTWATGEQAEVEAIEAGQLSSRGFADLSLAFANAPEDVPVDESGMIAMEVFRGPKGDKGEDGKDGADGKDGKDGASGKSFTDGYVTNCITEIPQDIKLELKDGTLTLKAGSKVYIPNGFEADGTTPKFDVVTIESDITATSSGVDGASLVYYTTSYEGSALVFSYLASDGESGTTPPTTGVYYNLSTNQINFTNSGTIQDQRSLPLGIVQRNNPIASIDQVFNEFGYIGSTAFALPGVKGLIPNGRNEDGSLKNIEFTVDKVVTRTITWNNAAGQELFIGKYNLNEDIKFISTGKIGQYYIQDAEPTKVQYAIWYKPSENKVYRCDSDSEGNLIWKDNFPCYIGQWFTSSTSPYPITKLTTKLPFRAVDYNDKETVVGWSIPDYTAGIDWSAAGTYTAPSSGWIMGFIRKSGSAANATLYVNDVLVARAGNDIATNTYWYPINIFIEKGQIYKAEYSATSIANSIIKFFPCKGVN